MDHLPNLVEEAAKSVNPREQGLPASNPSESVRSESQTPVKPNEALLRVAQDMARILDGLHESMKKCIAPVNTLQKKKGKRAREFQAEPAHGSATKRIRQNVTPISGRYMSSGQGNNLECPHCHRRHSGVCRVWTGGCFRCGSMDHFLANCPRESRVNINPQGSGRGRSVSTPSTWGRGGPNQHRGHGGPMSETVDHLAPIAPERAYVMQALEEQDAPDVIASMYSLFNN